MKKVKRKNKIYIGTSGWSFNWEKVFKEKIPKKNKLAFYCQKFNSVEANYSFYRLPSTKTLDNWQKAAKNNFKFTLKLSSYITHNKRLKAVKTPLKKFLRRYKRLGKFAGPILIQLPENFSFDKQRLEIFLENFKQVRKEFKLKPIQVAIEFRHKSWLENKKTKAILRQYDVALVFAHSSRYPYPREETATSKKFVYFRLHGPKDLFSSSYKQKELKGWAKKINKFSRSRTVYLYFNNDKYSYSMNNLLTLKKILENERD